VCVQAVIRTHEGRLSGQASHVKINIVRALTDAVSLVRAEGKLVHAGV
jgi:hypothetical protein